jgi:hypothetical protein
MRQILHILRFLHFSNSKKKPDETTKNYDRLWKMRTISEKLNDSYAKYYSPTEHLALDEITVPFKGNIVVFKHYIPKKCKQCGIKMYKFCYLWICIHHERVFRQRQMCDWYNDSYSCNSARTYYKDKKCMA